MEVFPGQQLTPPTVSLLSSADIIPMEGERWERGITLEHDGNSTPGIGNLLCDEGEDRMEEGAGAAEEYTPLLIWASDKCSTFASSTRQFYDRAQRKLLANESTILETILWTGSWLGTPVPESNPFLADTAQAQNLVPVTNLSSTWTASNAVNALAMLEQSMSSFLGLPNSSPSRGMIHMRTNVLYPLLAAQVIRRVGNVYLTPMDNIVVPGRGYPGTGPNGEAVGSTEWMFGHPGIVQIRRGPVIRLGENDLASQIDRSTNDRFVFAQRFVNVALDTSVGVFAVAFETVNTSGAT